MTLLDAGLADRGKWDSWKIQMPSSLAFNIGTTKYNWSCAAGTFFRIDYRQYWLTVRDSGIRKSRFLVLHGFFHAASCVPEVGAVLLIAWSSLVDVRR